MLLYREKMLIWIQSFWKNILKPSKKSTSQPLEFYTFWGKQSCMKRRFLLQNHFVFSLLVVTSVCWRVKWKKKVCAPVPDSLYFSEWVLLSLAKVCQEFVPLKRTVVNRAKGSDFPTPGRQRDGVHMVISCSKPRDPLKYTHTVSPDNTDDVYFAFSWALTDKWFKIFYTEEVIVKKWWRQTVTSTWLNHEKLDRNKIKPNQEVLKTEFMIDDLLNSEKGRSGDQCSVTFNWLNLAQVQTMPNTFI